MKLEIHTLWNIFTFEKFPLSQLATSTNKEKELLNTDFSFFVHLDKNKYICGTMNRNIYHIIHNVSNTILIFCSSININKLKII